MVMKKKVLVYFNGVSILAAALAGCGKAPLQKIPHPLRRQRDSPRQQNAGSG